MQNNKSSYFQNFPYYQVNQANRLKQILRIRFKNNSRNVYQEEMNERSTDIGNLISKDKTFFNERISNDLKDFSRETPIKVRSLTSCRYTEKNSNINSYMMNNCRKLIKDRKSKLNTCPSKEGSTIHLRIDASRDSLKSQGSNPSIFLKDSPKRHVKRIHSNEKLQKNVQKFACYDFFLQQNEYKPITKTKTIDFLKVKKFTPNVDFNKKSFNYMRKSTPKFFKNDTKRVKTECDQVTKPKIILYKRLDGSKKLECFKEKITKRNLHRVIDEVLSPSSIQKPKKNSAKEREKDLSSKKRIKNELREMKGMFINISSEDEDNDLNNYLLNLNRFGNRK